MIEAYKETGDRLTDEEFQKLGLIRWSLTGSQEICDPTPDYSDIDYICIAGQEIQEQVEEMERQGWTYEGNAPYRGGNNPSPFRSFRKGQFNLIVTEDDEFYHKFILATKVAKRINLLAREHRIDVFRAILYGEVHETNKAQPSS